MYSHTLALLYTHTHTPIYIYMPFSVKVHGLRRSLFDVISAGGDIFDQWHQSTVTLSVTARGFSVEK